MADIHARVKIRRGTSAEIQSALIEEYELLYATDTKRLYISNGLLQPKTGVCMLPEYEAVASFMGSKNQANGLAALDINSKVPLIQLPDTVIGAMQYKGTIDCSIGVYPSNPETGDYYVVSVAGTISSITYRAHDWIIYNGTGWDKIDNQLMVTSVNSKTGPVVLDFSDVGAIAASFLDSDVFLTADSDLKVPTQKAVKAYADTVLENSFDFEFDADLLKLDYAPSSYTPTIEPGCSAIDQLAAHLKGINDKLASLEARLDAHGI